MNPTEMAILGVGGVVVGFLAWNANRATGSQPVPAEQKETDVMGLGFQAGMRYNSGSNLDVSQEIHGWHPGYDPDESATPCFQNKHRYPVVPGGNVSYVMHHGWSRMSKDSPADNEWRIAPPEAAII